MEHSLSARIAIFSQAMVVRWRRHTIDGLTGKNHYTTTRILRRLLLHSVRLHAGYSRSHCCVKPMQRILRSTPNGDMQNKLLHAWKSHYLQATRDWRVGGEKHGRGVDL